MENGYRMQRGGERVRGGSLGRKVSTGRLPARKTGIPPKTLGEIAYGNPTAVRNYEQANREFLETFDTVKSHMPKGAQLSPKGDIGKWSEQELHSAFKRPIKAMGPSTPNPLTKMGKPRLMCSDVSVYGKLPPGEDTTGGVVGGKYDKGSHSGVKAGTR